LGARDESEVAGGQRLGSCRPPVREDERK